MIIAIPKEIFPGEKRTALTPASAKKLLQLGAEVWAESKTGEESFITDEDYTTAGVKIVSDRECLLENADIIFRVRKPPIEEIPLLKENAIHISFLDPFNETALIEKFASHRISAISVELIPRITRAQKMDALSSQANLAGYVTVVLAAERLKKIFPMMMTAAGTISPARVFVIGAGVAGLQAIATAKRLGARVEAFDTREVVAEQVQSLGAKFIRIDLGETGQTKDGYAKQLTPEQLAKQRSEMAKICAHSDVVITTAQVFGRKAPLIITKEMLQQIRPGTIIVDMAIESGGNVEGAKLNEEVDINGVKILGFANLPSRVPVNATEMYANNLYNLINEFWNKESKDFQLNTEDEIIQGCLVTHNGEIVNEKVKQLKG